MNNIKHLDLFSGIGGFSYAVDQVWPDAEHIFCETDEFCKKVIQKHWPESKIYGDIRTITHTGFKPTWTKESRLDSRRKSGSAPVQQTAKGNGFTNENCHMLTGGFPCQPFSAAGKRRGTADNRYLWPEMLRVIQLTNPTWVIAENVRGLVTWNKGMVFEQVCTDLEAEGYEVQPLIIPACAVNAPHRRERIWFIANSNLSKQRDKNSGSIEKKDSLQGINRQEDSTARKSKRTDRNRRAYKPDWEKNWLEVATRFCRMDDGIPDRVHRLKALGNAIVPQVAIQIMQSIKESEENV